METFKDFFSDLKDRISNPFISSFVISWLIINYPITIGLLFYDQEQLIVDSYTSYLDLIARNKGLVNMIFYPSGFALFYTFLFPYFKARIIIFNSTLTSSTDSKIHALTGKDTVTIEVHGEMAKSLDDEKKKYAMLAADGNRMKEENENLKISEIQLQDELKQMTLRLEESVNNHNLEIIDINARHDIHVNEIMTRENHRAEEIQRMGNEIHRELSQEKVDLEKSNMALTNENTLLSEQLVDANKSLSEIVIERYQLWEKLKDERTKQGNLELSLLNNQEIIVKLRHELDSANKRIAELEHFNAS
jgi:hypothetical protein